MNDVESIEAVRAIARILVGVYFRIRRRDSSVPPVDCAETKRESCDKGLTQ